MPPTIAYPHVARHLRKFCKSPNEKLNIAGIGVGGKGKGDIASTSKGQNVVAICDVDERTLGASAKLYPGAKKYTDWRKLLEQKDIDAVTISTPDHMHAPIAMSAIQLGKHVYVQKPLAHTVYEARQLTRAARKYGVISQMGNQAHSGAEYRTLVQLIQSGVIGKIKHAHAWSNRPVWPQGIERPGGSSPIPPHLHWDLWLGVAPYRPYLGPRPDSVRNRGVYNPFNWRGWLDFGVGALGDMGCHIIDPVVWSLELGAPTQIWSDGTAPNGETYPNSAVIHYQFARTKFTAGDTLKMTWYDGGNLPDRSLVPLPDDVPTPKNGSLYVGEKGTVLCPHGRGGPSLLPAERFADVAIEKVKRSDHYQQWTNACKGDDKATSHFDYSGPLTETVLLGTIALRYPGKKLRWDSENLKVANVEKANAFVHHPYRAGWEVPGLSTPLG